MRGKAYRRGGGLDQEPRVCAPFCLLSGRRTKADIVDGGGVARAKDDAQGRARTERKSLTRWALPRGLTGV